MAEKGENPIKKPDAREKWLQEQEERADLPRRPNEKRDKEFIKGTISPDKEG